MTSYTMRSQGIISQGIYIRISDSDLVALRNLIVVDKTVHTGFACRENGRAPDC